MASEITADRSDDYRCECGEYNYERCAECQGCGCPDNPRLCVAPGCISIDEVALHHEEMGY